MIDGKPLPVGGASHDPDARNGHGAGKIAKGYKLHAIWGRAAVPEAWSVEPLNVCETKAAEALLASAPGPGGYLLGDGEYDATAVYDAAGVAGYQLVAARRAERRAGPSNRAGIGSGASNCRSEFGEALYAARRSIERRFGNATSFGRAGPAAGLGPKDVAGLALDMGEVDDQRGADPRETRTYVAYAISWLPWATSGRPFGATTKMPVSVLQSREIPEIEAKQGTRPTPIAFPVRRPSRSRDEVRGGLFPGAAAVAHAGQPGAEVAGERGSRGGGCVPGVLGGRSAIRKLR